MILAFGADTPVWVEVSDPPLVPKVAALFAPMRAPDHDDRGSPFVAVVPSPDGWILRGQEPAAEPEAFRRLPDLLAALEHRMALRLLDTYHEHAHLHAGGAVAGHRAVLALGASGAGKSSIALAWSLAGLPILGDDAVLLGPDARVRAFPRLVKVDRGRLAPAGLLLEDTVAPDPDSREAWHDPSTAGGWARGALEVGLVASVRFSRGGATRISDLSETEALRMLLDHTTAAGPAPERCLDRFIAVASSARAVEVTFGDASSAADALVTHLLDGTP